MEPAYVCATRDPQQEERCRRSTFQCRRQAKPVDSPSAAYAIPPKARPVAIALVSGMVMRTAKAGMAMRASSRSIPPMPRNHCADHDEGGRGGEVGDGSDQRSYKDCHKEEQPGDDRGDAGSPSGGHAGGRLDVTGDGGGPGQRADDGGGSVGKKDAVETRNGVVGGDEPGAVGDGHQGADVVELLRVAPWPSSPRAENLGPRKTSA